jgi:ABC-type dipeptide/oligopeptide/nickel transport system ATPase component
MSETILSVRDLTVAFDTRRGPLTAIDRVSFDIGRGEILGVVGESGAGKSVTGSAARSACGASASTTSPPRRCGGCGAGASA